MRGEDLMSGPVRMRKGMALSGAVLLGTTFGVGTVAQTQGSDGALEEVVVTGSLIKRDGFGDRAPMQVVSQESLRSAGYSSVVDVARDLVVNSGSVLTQDIGTLLGIAQFNIRGLGLGSTLTLINGRRAGIAAIADGGGSEFFDINQLPLAMIERIDFLKDGASATYGSQAVAGVANIITRKGFEGLEISAHFEDASNQAGSLSLAAGTKSDRSTFNLYATYYDQTRNDRSDFDWLVDRIGGGGDPLQSVLTSTTGQPGSYVRAVTDAASGEIRRFSNATIPDPNCAAAGGILQGSRCRMDFFDQVSVIQDERRAQVFSEYSYELTDRLEFFSEAHISRNRVDRTSGPGLFQNGLVDNGSIFVPADHPFNFFVADPAASTGMRYIDPAQWDNAVHQAVDVVCICRPFGAEFNGKGNDEPRRVNLDYWRGLAGLSADLGGTWTGELWYQYSSARRDEQVGNNFIADNINAAAIDGTWNPFGSARATPNLLSPKDGVSIAANDPEVLASLRTFESNTFKSSQYTVDAVVTGDVADLPAGPMTVAFGSQYRFEEFAFRPDALKAAAGAESRDPILPSAGEQDVYSVFAESIIPITARLDLQLAGRYEDYGDQGGDTTDPKVAIRFLAAEWLALRGSYGTSFQAPSTRQVSTSSSRQVFDDPASINPVSGALECVDRGTQISGEVRVGGGENLSPQSAKNFNVGAVLRPFDGFTVSLDYWTFDYEDLITLDEGAQAILENDCGADGIPNDPRIERDSGGNIRRVNSSFVNTGSVKTDGLDLGVGYDFSIGRFGELALSSQASYIDKFTVKTTDDAPSFDAVGSRNFLNQFRSLPQWRANTSVQWTLASHTLTTTVRHIDGYLNDQNNVSVAAHTTLDLQYAFSTEKLLNGRLTVLRLGANNVLDRDPPSIGAGTRPGFDEEVHDVRGRIMYISATQSF